MCSLDSPNLIQESKVKSLRGLEGYCLPWRGTQPPHLFRRVVSGSRYHCREESPGVGGELGHLVLAAFVRHLLQPEMFLPGLSMLLRLQIPSPASSLLDQHLLYFSSVLAPVPCSVGDLWGHGQGEEEGSENLCSPIHTTPEDPSPPWPSAALIYPPACWVHFGGLLFPCYPCSMAAEAFIASMA